MRDDRDDSCEFRVVEGMINALVLEVVFIGLMAAVMWNIWALV